MRSAVKKNCLVKHGRHRSTNRLAMNYLLTKKNFLRQHGGKARQDSNAAVLGKVS